MACLPRVRMNPGENSRICVLTPDEENAYLQAALNLGRAAEKAYEQALKGIRVTLRNEQPIKPDSNLLHDVATVLLDFGLRPDECYRLKWEQIRDDAIEIHNRKGAGSRRRVPCSPRVLSILEVRRAYITSEWVFPRDTKSGHIEVFTLLDQHYAAVTMLL